MSQEKQMIEETAKDICLATQQTNYKCNDMCEKQGSCAYCNVIAEYLYNANNRKQGWISVEERLPDTTEKILVYCSNGEILPAQYIRVQGLEFWFEETYSCHNITHWMPLPEAPRGGGE